MEGWIVPIFPSGAAPVWAPEICEQTWRKVYKTERQRGPRNQPENNTSQTRLNRSISYNCDSHTNPSSRADLGADTFCRLSSRQSLQNTPFTSFQGPQVLSKKQGHLNIFPRKTLFDRVSYRTVMVLRFSMWISFEDQALDGVLGAMSSSTDSPAPTHSNFILQIFAEPPNFSERWEEEKKTLPLRQWVGTQG